MGSTSGDSPLDIYSIACQLGVGYDTLVRHLKWSENLLDHARMLDLQRIPPKEIRRNVLGAATAGHMVFADAHWRRVAIDLEVGDFAVIPHHIRLNGASARIVRTCAHGEVVGPGLTQAIGESDWAHMIRVSRKQFVGRGAFRHLEETNENDDSSPHN